jgi:hypothetical protein
VDVRQDDMALASMMQYPMGIGSTVQGFGNRLEYPGRS